MRSDWYDLKSSGNALAISGRGYGHGVGLCQAGAYQMASEGHSESDILRFYFPGTTAGITPQDHGWHDVAGKGWTLRTTTPATGKLVQDGNAAWTQAQSLLGSPAGVQNPIVQEMPTTELFRQTTNQPGWMLASTRGQIVFLQPLAVRQSNGGTETLLLHEFLHVLIEQQAGESAPLWLREGLVETLAGQNHPNQPLDLSPDEVNAALAHPTSADASRHAHSVAARLTELLRARYGMPAIRQFLRNGVPSGVARTLGS
jgi:stage II sporulation protein D